MSGSREAFGAALVLEMRAPLARVGLAASQLAREAPTPGARALASAVREAAAELDELIAQTLEILLPRPTPAQGADLAEVLRELRERLAPVLAARDVTWEPQALERAPVEGAPERVRACCLALLRAAAALAGPGGSFALEPLCDGVRSGVALRSPCGSPRGAAAREVALAELRQRILAAGDCAELRESRDAAELWFARAESSCAAS